MIFGWDGAIFLSKFSYFTRFLKNENICLTISYYVFFSFFRKYLSEVVSILESPIRHFSLLNVNAAGACGYDFLCDGGRLVRAYVRLRRGAI